METNQTTKLNHLPEPWTVNKNDVGNFSVLSQTKVCNFYNSIEHPFHSAEANAERIVQCVNACAQIDNPEEFIQSARDSIVEALKIRNENTRVIAENEELKNALNVCFTRTRIEQLQNEVYEITGKGEVMQLFNKLLGVNAG